MKRQCNEMGLLKMTLNGKKKAVERYNGGVGRTLGPREIDLDLGRFQVLARSLPLDP